MSNDEGASSGSSQSTSDSSTSSGKMSFFYDNLNDAASNIDLTLYGSPAPTFVRTGTVVRRANSVPSRKEIAESNSSNEDDETSHAKEVQYRHSLASISERKSSRSSFSKSSGRTTTRTPFSSMETSSDPDYAIRSASVESTRDMNRTVYSPTSTNYLSWIESVNTEYSDSAILNLQDHQEPDSKVGEWNNFWLNYSNARLRHLSERTFSSNFHDVIMGDEGSDEGGGKSRESTPRDVSRTSSERVLLTLDEVNETIKCSKRIAEILENATKRSQMDSDSNESYYSQAMSGKASIKDDVILPSIVNSYRERSVSWVVDSHGQTTIQQKPKQSLQKNDHSSSTSCINAILNTGNDILKRVIAKRREVVAASSASASSSPSRSVGSVARSSFSDWGIQ